MPRYDEDERDDYEEKGRTPTTFPITVRLAGIIWLLMGLLILGNAAVNVIMNVIAEGNQQPNANMGGPAANVYISAAIGFVIGLVFLMVGVQTARGTAKDTLGNSIGSFVFAFLYLGCGAVAMVGIIGVGGARVNQQFQIVLIVAAIIATLSGFGLLLAGVLGLIGRKQYKAWYKAKNKAKRRQEREDYDD